MKKEMVLEIMHRGGFIFDEEKSIPFGVQLVFRNGSKVSVYNSGAVSPQGKVAEYVRNLLGLNAPTPQPHIEKSNDSF